MRKTFTYNSLREIALTGLFLLLCGFMQSVLAQQGNIWYFGRVAGTDFTNGSPTALTNGVLNTFEGCASIADSTGKLLFYTDGKTVFDRTHQAMPNGQNLIGHVSAFQSCVIVPRPGNNNIYYIFTADALEDQGEAGYAFSEVDMRLNNGLGDVTSRKNVVLSAPGTERLCIARAANYIDWWVITNEWSSNTFRVYKVDCNGVNTTPVVSNAGRVLNDNDGENIGAMKVNAANNLLCQTNNKGRLETNPTNEFAQLFNFDNLTGQITNAREIPLINDGYYMGCEFSPDSKLLYIIDQPTTSVHQFDVSSGNIANIMASKIILPLTNTYLSGIQMGPDQKLYLTSNEKFLHVINAPNSAGMGCNLVEKQVDLQSGKSVLALPNFPTNFFADRTIDYSYTILDSCAGLVQFTAALKIPAAFISWDFGDGTTSNQPNPQHVFVSKNKQYTVSLHIHDATGCVDLVCSKNIHPNGSNLRALFGAKVDCKSLTVVFTDSTITGVPNIQYNWSFGDGTSSTNPNPVHQYSQTSTYTVQLTVNAANSCLADIFSYMVDLTAPNVQAGNDLLITTISPIQLKVIGAQTYQWSPPTYLNNPVSATPTFTPYDDVQYIIKGYSKAGCEGVDTLNIKILKGTVVEVPNAFSPFSHSTNYLLRPLLRRIKKLNYFIVYNRWGQKIYETHTPGEGWNGTFNGKLQASGVYIWALQVEDADGKIISKKGTSVLIR